MKISLGYKIKLPDSKKAAHIMRLGNVHYADVLTAKERACPQPKKRSCTSKEVLECMTNVWKRCGGIPSEGSNHKTADELALANLQNKGNGFQGTCHNCDKKEHMSEDYRGPKKDKSNKTNSQGGRNKKHCDHYHRDGHTEAECFRKPGDLRYTEFKAKGGNKEASNVGVFLTSAESITEEFIEAVEPTELCLANMDRYANNMQYESQKKKCANHDMSYNIEESNEERWANDGEYESKQKSDQAGGVKLSYVEALIHLSTIGKVESVEVTSMYIVVDKFIADPHFG